MAAQREEGDGVNLTAIEAAIRAVAAAKAARKAFEAEHNVQPGCAYFWMDEAVYARYHRLIMAYHEASAALWRAVSQAVEEVTG